MLCQRYVTLFNDYFAKSQNSKQPEQTSPCGGGMGRPQSRGGCRQVEHTLIGMGQDWSLYSTLANRQHMYLPGGNSLVSMG